MKQIVEQLKSHVAAGYQPMPRGDAPPDDTLAQAWPRSSSPSVKAALHRPTAS